MMKPSLASLYQAVEIGQSIPPLLVGERANANGSKAFRDCLLAEDFEGCLKIAQSQEGEGAHVVDLCTAYAGRDEAHDLPRLVAMAAKTLKAPLMIDSTTPDCIEACLKIYPGRCIVNSINLEDGGRNLERVCIAARKYGAAVVALTIDESGMAMTADDKVRVARKIHDLAVGRFGLRPSDILFDPLTFTVGAGDETLRDAAVQTLAGIRRIKAALPGVFTILGVSNISFGLAPHARRVLNSVFLHDAVEAGLDAAIVHAGKVLPMAKISEEDRTVCRDLLFDRPGGGGESPLMRFIAHFSGRRETTADDDETSRRRTGEAQLFARVVDGDKSGVEDLLSILLQRYRPVDIINDILVPAMRHVGDLFGKGELLLPFVLQSAEVMKHSVNYLEPLMDKTAAGSGTRILLATVQGDVHDIGKNLVEIILSNNGYKVYNLGIKVPAETIIEKAREYQVDAVGLSGLLVKSAIVMKETMPQYAEAKLGVPILLGGAALTRKFVARECVPGYDRPVVYCADAFAGLKAVRDLEAGTLAATVWEGDDAVKRLKPGPKEADLNRDNPVPQAPFTGARHVENIPLDDVLPLVNVQALFRGRWGFRRGKMSAAEYDALIKNTVEPLYARLIDDMRSPGTLNLKVAYGYFPCRRDGDAVIVESPNGRETFAFPRQDEPPHRCIADYFRSRDEGGDLVGFFVASAGEEIARRIKTLYDSDSYHDYLMVHGLSVEITDALAEYWHAVMRRELGIANDEPETVGGFVSQQYQGSRYGFGYPACPDLEAHLPLFRLLEPGKIGVSLTDNMEMVPEQSTSAIVAHHPQAKYFAI